MEHTLSTKWVKGKRNQKKFCGVCGVKLRNDKSLYFEEETGMEIVLKVCPTALCGHASVEHDLTDYQWFQGDYCRKCGFKPSYGGDI